MNAVLERPAATEMPALPNKFIYPEFAGFAGEDLLHEIVREILPSALYRTWEIFESKHAYGNDCYLSLSSVASKGGRAARTIERHIAKLCSQGLLILHSETKTFCDEPGGILRAKTVMIKDFSGLYTLAHEYYLWQHSGDYYAPDSEGIALIRTEPRLVAKLSRFEKYRRLLESHHEPLYLHVEADPRFAYDEASFSEEASKHVKDAKEQKSDPNATFLLSKVTPKGVSKVSKERINEKAYSNSLRGDSFDSDEDQEMGGEADAHPSRRNEPVAPDYTKQVRRYETGASSPNESQTNLVSPSSQNVPPGAGKTSESSEEHPNVQRARQAMEVAGIEPGRYRQRQAEELPLPPKHPLARSFVHEIASLFGDVNEKGSKTGIERCIETFELEQPAAVLMCLVRAYVVARDTKAETIRYHHPETGAPNRMPLWCSMFKAFARALASGSPWDYPWQKMLEDIEADDRLSLWLGEHQAELVAAVNHQAGPSEGQEAEEEVQEEPEAEAEEPGEPSGWAEDIDAYRQAERLMRAIVDANYGGIEVALRPGENGRYLVVYKVLEGESGELVLSNEEEIAYLIEQAERGQL